MDGLKRQTYRWACWCVAVKSAYRRCYWPTWRRLSGSCRPSPSCWRGGNTTRGWSTSLEKDQSKEAFKTETWLERPGDKSTLSTQFLAFESITSKLINSVFGFHFKRCACGHLSADGNNVTAHQNIQSGVSTPRAAIFNLSFIKGLFFNYCTITKL